MLQDQPQIKNNNLTELLYTQAKKNKEIYFIIKDKNFLDYLLTDELKQVLETKFEKYIAKVNTIENWLPSFLNINTTTIQRVYHSPYIEFILDDEALLKKYTPQIETFLEKIPGKIGIINPESISKVNSSYNFKKNHALFIDKLNNKSLFSIDLTQNKFVKYGYNSNKSNMYGDIMLHLYLKESPILIGTKHNPF